MSLVSVPFSANHVGHDVVGHGNDGHTSQIHGLAPTVGLFPDGAHHDLHLLRAGRFEVVEPLRRHHLRAVEPADVAKVGSQLRRCDPMAPPLLVGGVGEVLGAQERRRTCGEDLVLRAEHLTHHGRRGDDDGGGGSQVEVHEGAVFLSELRHVLVRHVGEKRQVAHHGNASRARRKTQRPTAAGDQNWQRNRYDRRA